MRSLLLLGCVWLVGSCAFTHTVFTPIGQLYREALPEWTGENIQKLTKQWGYPTAKDVAPNGNPLWIYSCSTNEGECKTHIETDGDGVIVNWQVEGSACPCGGDMGRYYNPSPLNPSRKGL
jgi:hypothetical protein